MADFVCISPVDGSEYLRRRQSSDSEVEASFRAARNAQAGWAATPLAERERYCTAAVDAMLAMTEQIVPELAWQMGRPVAQGAGELRGFEERARHMIAIAGDALAPINPGPKTSFKRYIRRVPKGVVLVIAPWNFPLMTAVNSVIPALMAGNTVVLKHAQQTLGIGERFADAFRAAGLPKGVFSHCPMTHAQTAEMIGKGAADQINFTGSVRSGAEIERAAAGTFAGLGLELGGKDPAYVRADADLDFTAENLADGAFFNAGQSCCAVERVYVHESIHDELVERLTGHAQALVLGNPLEPDTTIGPMISGDAADFVRDQVDAAVAAGATRHLPAKRFDLCGRGSAYMAPQVLSGVDHSMSVMSEESFGPVVGVMKVGSDEQAVELMNDSPYGLTASIWSRDLDAVERMGPRIETGTIFMNRCDYLDPALAWTGVKRTGKGASLSVVGYETLTRPMSYHLRLLD